MLDSPCLKDTKSGASAMADGSEFHVMIVLGKKLFGSMRQRPKINQIEIFFELYMFDH